MEDAPKLWTKCSHVLRNRLTEVAWNTSFGAAWAVPTDDPYLTLAVPSAIAKERIESRFLDELEEILTEAVGAPTSVRLEVRTGVPGDTQTAPPPGFEEEFGTSRAPGYGIPADAATDSAVATLAPEGAPDAYPPGELAEDLPPFEETYDRFRDVSPRRAADDDNPFRYTFDAFVIGSANRFAHAAALSVAETPAKAYNPLFIHGEAGLGKTHLLHAIGNYVREHYPSYKLTYVSTETFMNEFVEAIRRGTTSEFKARYRGCDLLLVDDIQFMEGKEGLQEEFFHTFNTLHGSSKQIVLTSDRPPKAIATLERRLSSRFQMGLITDIQPPDLETRLAILRKKAAADGAQTSDDVLEFIATHVSDNIRELEGALIRATAYESLSGVPLDRQRAEEVLSDIVSAPQSHTVTPATILAVTAHAFGFTVDELTSSSRRRPLTTARQIAMYLCRELTEYSYPAIGNEFGGRDHTTAIHAVSKVSELMKQRTQIYEQVNDLRQQIRSGITS